MQRNNYGIQTGQKSHSKRKPEESLQREGKRPEFDRLAKDLRTLLEAKCLPIAQRCKDEGLTEMVR